MSGARTRISTFLAGVFLLILVVALGDVVGVIPMAARQRGKDVQIVGLNEPSQAWHSRLSGRLRAGG